jgi:peptidoglycan/xylan/chitin deacetylase (PgdA/CDA1 family)
MLCGGEGGSRSAAAAATDVDGGVSKVASWSVNPRPQVAVTMDDFNWGNAVKLSAVERNEAILKTLNKHAIKAALFVMGRNIDSEEGKQRLKPWNEAGHLIGNHTFHRFITIPMTAGV